MESIEHIFSDNKGNHLMVALNFYDYSEKIDTLKIPPEFADIEIADINIEKSDLDEPLHYGAFAAMTQWLSDQFVQHPNAVFSFICSLDELATNHDDMRPERYRWNLFDALFRRFMSQNDCTGIRVQDVIFGPQEYLSYTRTFYRDRHAPIIHIVSSYLKEKDS